MNNPSATTIPTSNTTDIFSALVSYASLLIIFVGVVGNLAALLIFRLNKEMAKMPSMVYLSFVCVTDTISLFDWNLSHFLKPNFNISIEALNVYSCRVFQFLQYASLQCSGLLLAIVCVDRYFTVINTPGSSLAY